jgi:hypothetical protein
MYDKVNIYFIYADDCIECKKQKEIITRAISDCKIETVLYEINSETEDAIRLSIDNGIDDLPAYVIGRYSFCGKECLSYHNLIAMIGEVWKEQKDQKERKNNQ